MDLSAALGSIHPVTFVIGGGCLAALAFLSFLVGTQTHLRRRRIQRFEHLELRPNVLLTRFPLVFVSRPKSLFHLAGDFLELPAYLAEHGYRTEEVEIPDRADRHALLTRLLDASREPLHLFVAEAFTSEALDLALEGHSQLASLTLMSQSPDFERSYRLLPYKVPVFEKVEIKPSLLATSFRSEERALDHLVSLAEYDLR